MHACMLDDDTWGTVERTSFLSLQALKLCQASECAAADKLLAWLGCKYRLAPEAFQHGMYVKAPSVSATPCSTGRVCVLPSAISGQQISQALPSSSVCAERKFRTLIAIALKIPMCFTYSTGTACDWSPTAKCWPLHQCPCFALTTISLVRRLK